MNKRSTKSLLQKLTVGMSGVMAAAFLFAAMPVQVEAVTIGSSPSGTSAVVNEDGSEGSTESQVGSVTVTASDVNIRSDASTSASKVGQASSGTEATVSGEKTDSSGKTWYAISFEQNGNTITGYIREDFVQTHAAEVVEETPAEETPVEETPAEQEEPVAPTDDYYVQYSTDENGAGAWYLHDNTMGTRYQVSELLAAEETNANNAELMESQTGKLKMVIVIMAAVILVLIVLVTVFIIKLRNAYDDDDYDDEDEDDEDEEEEDDEEEEEERPRRRLFSRRSRYEEDDEDEEEEDDEEEEEEYRPSRRAAKPAMKEKRRSRYEEEDEDEEEEEEYRPRRSAKASKGQNDKNWQSKNFLDDDDLEFEFLDLK